ncbi:glycoside hydrolase family 10 protein [Pseudostreptobacillus sp.]
MKKIIFGLVSVAFLISCSTTEETKKDLYKEYNPKYELNFDETKKEGEITLIKIEDLEKEKKSEVKDIHKINEETSKIDNEEILSNENLKTNVFDRNQRVLNNNLKGVWVATVARLDFPHTSSAESQKKEIDTIMDNVKSWGLNAVFFHVRPTADAFYLSENEPWSIYLTGIQDKYPGFDPLEYAIEAAHSRGLELHAWINPYRSSMNLDLDKLSSKSVVKKHPEWIFTYDNKFYMNPGNPEVVKYVSKEIEYIVSKYDIDGLHLDDYFYPYPSATSSLPENVDDKEYEIYGKNFDNKADWRRDNVNNMIKNLSVSVHKIKPGISFGVSPFGIWRNKDNDLTGSDTKGLQSYDSLYADSIEWMKEGWVDYIAPQIYWKIGHSKADYSELVKWWSQKARETNTPLYVGQGTYKVNEWEDSEETTKQLKLNESYPEVKGTIFFRYETLLNNPKNVLEQIKENLK